MALEGAEVAPGNLRVGERIGRCVFADQNGLWRVFKILEEEMFGHSEMGLHFGLSLEQGRRRSARCQFPDQEGEGCEAGRYRVERRCVLVCGTTGSEDFAGARATFFVIEVRGA